MHTATAFLGVENGENANAPQSGDLENVPVSRRRRNSSKRRSAFFAQVFFLHTHLEVQWKPLIVVTDIVINRL